MYCSHHCHFGWRHSSACNMLDIVAAEIFALSLSGAQARAHRSRSLEFSCADCRLSIVDCRSVRHIAQGVLAHILGRLPCPKKTPRKIGNSMLAQCQYRMKIRKAESRKVIAESSAALQKFAKISTNLQIALLFVHIKTAKLLQNRQLRYIGSTKVD